VGRPEVYPDKLGGPLGQLEPLSLPVSQPKLESPRAAA
jgi:hypothetical protein